MAPLKAGYGEGTERSTDQKAPSMEDDRLAGEKGSRYQATVVPHIETR